MQRPPLRLPEEIPDGTVAFVTGASGAIGGAICRDLDRMGLRVAVGYCVHDNEASALADSLVNETVTCQVDVSDWESVVAAEKEVRTQLGPAGVVVNCGGIRLDGLMVGQAIDDWRRVIDVNLIGTFHVIRATLSGMMSARFGRVVNIVSPAGLIGNAGQTAYSASKAGVIGMTRSLAREYARRNITANAVAPGFVDTAMTSSLPASARDALLGRAAISRAAQPEEIASGVSFLVRNGYVTGQVLSIDGGLTI